MPASRSGGLKFALLLRESNLDFALGRLDGDRSELNLAARRTGSNGRIRRSGLTARGLNDVDELRNGLLVVPLLIDVAAEFLHGPSDLFKEDVGATLCCG